MGRLRRGVFRVACGDVWDLGSLRILGCAAVFLRCFGGAGAETVGHEI